jgi:hypothetical protein
MLHRSIVSACSLVTVSHRKNNAKSGAITATNHNHHNAEPFQYLDIAALLF